MKQPIDFVIITALEEELDAVLAKLPDYRKLSPSEDSVRTYYQANLSATFPDGSHCVYHVIVMSLLGMGRVQAATATSDAITQWHPSYLLLVGIAGGIAERKVSLGDILISDQIVDYELQKITAKGPEIRWEVHQADPRLFGAVRNLRNDDWIETIGVERPEAGKPVRHIGPIASGDKVIAFGDALRTYRSAWSKLIGVEMEAAGAATVAFQAAQPPGFFMIRSVSDLADKEKGTAEVEKWRDYACHAAAAYAIEFLRSGPIPAREKRFFLTEESAMIADENVRKNLPLGVKLVRTLRGHTEYIGRIAWSPDARLLASPSADKTIRLWDAETGNCLYSLNGHEKTVYSVAFDPAGKTLASGSGDGLVKTWGMPNGNQLLDLSDYRSPIGKVTFDRWGNKLAVGGAGSRSIVWNMGNIKATRWSANHTGSISDLSFDPLGRYLATSWKGDPSEIHLNDASSGRLIHAFVGHQSNILSIAFNSSGQILASGSADTTIKLWATGNGKQIRSLEGHTAAVDSVAFSSDDRLLASKGLDDSIRIWRVDDGACVATIPESSSGEWPPSLVFHPRLPLLATVGSDPGTPKEDCDRVIHIWELDPAILLGQAVAPTVTYTSAKVVLVGESNVGKSYLAHRIATGLPPKEGTIKSTHGMKLWSIEPERFGIVANPPEGQRRDVVLWDMGGQQEYRLVHQLFLQDTVVALVLLDPTRGVTAINEVETWNKYLEKQLRNRAAVKLLVGAKIDQPTNMIDRQALNRLCAECGFAGYYETSAITGGGVPELCDAVAKAIDWNILGQINRPELFQRIRDEIEIRRKRGEVILHVVDLHRVLSDLLLADTDKEAVNAVTKQLAAQGMIAHSRFSSGESVLILQVHEIERYAGSLIAAARINPRGVPALELQAIAQADFSLPGIADHERLPRSLEKPVLECTVQLLLEHGICFQHEGLLIFPSLFTPALKVTETVLPHAVSLYYDVAGAIDNIYASLVASLVLARDFGRVRLGVDQAEFEVKDGGFCGLHKVARPGGFARVDVYFEANTPERRRNDFINFVKDHLTRNSVENHEHFAIKCSCGHQFIEETLRQRIARGDRDIICPICEIRHSLIENAVEVREHASSTQHTLEVIEERKRQDTRNAVQMIARTPDATPEAGKIRLLHLSDLHFNQDTPVKTRLQWLLDDIKQNAELGFSKLDYLVISGDFTDKGCAGGFEKAYDFVSELMQAFRLSAERCIFVPGNHDVRDLKGVYELWEGNTSNLKDGEWVRQGEAVLVRNADIYPLRFKPFSDEFFHKFLQRPYPEDYENQGISVPFWETGIQFLAFNSCWQIDRFNRKRAGLFPGAIAHALREAQKQEDDARNSGQLAAGQSLLRIAVWHHSITMPDCKMSDLEFTAHLQNNGVKLALHGDVHEMRRDILQPWEEKKLHIVGSGSFGARAEERPESTPGLYNVLEISRDLQSIRVHTRKQDKPDGVWDGWYQWRPPDGGMGRLPYYDIKL